jgi:hypothetical protein
MTLFNEIRKFLLPLGAIAGIGLGCVIGGDIDDCTTCGEATSCHSELINGECFCEDGYQWEHPNDLNNYECERAPGKGGGNCPDPNSSLQGDQCFCDTGFSWCNPANADDLTCCDDDDPKPGTGGGTDTAADTGGTSLDTGTGTGVDTGGTGGPTCNFDGGAECPAPVPPDDSECTEDGLFACTNTEADGPECSGYFECMGGQWVLNETFGDETCQFDGFDFSYGCVVTENEIEFLCGLGPGTGCEGECSECVDAEVVNFCQFGKVSSDNCMVICTEIGDENGVTYDFGECLEGECACCDSGTEGCPV